MRIYISGPMTGYPGLNFAEFAKVAGRLRGEGHGVVSPAEIEQPILTWQACMREDIKQLMECDTVAVLLGWEKSKGARIEVGLARSLGMSIVDAYTLEPLELEAVA